jgi:flagellar FliL protein
MLGKGKKKGKDEHAAPDGAPAADGEAAEGQEAGGKKKLPMKLIIIAMAGLLVVGGGGGTAAFLLMKPKHPAGEQLADAHGKEKPKDKKKKKEGHGAEGKSEEGMGKISEGPEGVTYYTLPAVVSDMQGADGRPSQMKIGMTFELADEETADILNENMPRVKDMLQTFLREMRPEDLAGSQGTFRLRQELMRRVNLIIAPNKINTINLTEIVIT